MEKAWFVTSSQRRCLAYLHPDQQSARLRRGRFCRGYSTDGAAQARNWTLDAPPAASRYAQIAPADHPFKGTPQAPDESEHPFQIEGKVTDVDLVAPVDYFRTSSNNVEEHPLPPSPDGAQRSEITGGSSADGKQRIIRLRCAAPDSVVIVTEHRPGTGQTLTFRKVDGRWKIVKAAYWVA